MCCAEGGVGWWLEDAVDGEPKMLNSGRMSYFLDG